MGFRNRYKRRELACPREQGAETRAHTCRTDANKTGNENVLQDKAADKETGGRVVRDMKVRARFKYREWVLLRGGRAVVAYPMYFTQTECLGWLCCLAWQPFGSSSNGTDTLQWSQIQWSPGKQSKNVLGPNPGVVGLLRASERWRPKKGLYRSLQMFLSAKDIVCEYGACAVAFRQPCTLFLFFLCRKRSHIKHYTFYSIGWHYQQQCDYWLHVDGEEQ